MAARSQSQNTYNKVEELKADLVVDVRRSQGCDFDEFLKTCLYYILEEHSEEKKILDDLQERIEKLERDLDAAVRVARAPNQNNQAQGPSEDEISKWKKDAQGLVAQRKNILDRLLDDCLTKVLPICHDRVLKNYLKEYSQAKTEKEFYIPFVDCCNRALDLLKIRLSIKSFLATSELNCRFLVNDPRIITTNYGDSAPSVHCKPDVVATSAIAAHDFEFREKKNFEMHQILSAIEFKKREGQLTEPFDRYTKTRQCLYKTDDKELSELYPIDDSSAPIVVIDREEPPQKRARTEESEQAEILSGPSKESGSRFKNTQTGSRQGTESKDETTHHAPNNSQNMIDARTQCAVYGMEMLSYATGVHRAIALLIIDCKLWIWYYDRQGVIQSNGIDFIADLPRFLVLLFAFQRFQLFDWGVISELNPNAVLAHNPTPPIKQDMRRSVPRAAEARQQNQRYCILKNEKFDSDSIGGHARERLKEIKIDLTDWLSHKPHCLGGRATAVLGSSDGEFALKISFPELARENEGKIIEDLRQQIEQDTEWAHLSKHLPDVLMYGEMSRYGTQRIRSMLGIKIEGHRILRAIVSKKLAPLTSVVGEAFVKAWLEVVRFHAFLWNRYVEHGDPSLWNVMYNKDLDCGVLGDYDLAISRLKPRVPGTDRTGTIPFMAIDLLNDGYWNGGIVRLYRHEFEAFLWMIPFVFLRYQNGKPQQGTLVDAWMTSNYITCAKEKNHFWTIRELRSNKEACQLDFRGHWTLLRKLLFWWSSWLTAVFASRPNIEIPFESENSVCSIWPLFVDQLKLVAKEDPSLIYIDTLIDKLQLEKQFWV